MSKESYNKKLDEILKLTQFEKMEKTRSNGKEFIIKEEKDIEEALKKLLDEENIDEQSFQKMKPIGSKAPRLYGLAKVHKKHIPLRPVLSMPGSPYYNIGKFLSQYLARVPECNIQTSTEEISNKIKNIEIEEDEELISFDVSSLYTNVPIEESIHDCANLLYAEKNHKGVPYFSKETFIKLALMATSNVIMLTHDGYYKQTDGLAMGSPLAPFLANAWMSKFDAIIATMTETKESCGENVKNQTLSQRAKYDRKCKIKSEYSKEKQPSSQKSKSGGRVRSKLYERYMDDIITIIKKSTINNKLDEINQLHRKLTFTKELEEDGIISFLDMLLMRNGNHICSTWFTKATDTGLMINFHALAPNKFKRSMIVGMVHRIYKACSHWQYITESLTKAKAMLKANQYPEEYIEKTISETLTNIIQKQNKEHDQNEEKIEEEKKEDILFFINYRGKITEEYCNSLRKICFDKDSPASHIPIKIIMTSRKLKTVLPSLKPPVEKILKSDVVYKITCSLCKQCYVGKTERHVTTRLREHILREGPMKSHAEKCGEQITNDNITIEREVRDRNKLSTYEALYIKIINPQINTKDEFRRKLYIKWIIDSIYSK